MIFLFETVELFISEYSVVCVVSVNWSSAFEGIGRRVDRSHRAGTEETPLPEER